jgi:hypothetical protein
MRKPQPDSLNDFRNLIPVLNWNQIWPDAGCCAIFEISECRYPPLLKDKPRQSIPWFVKK